jgi:hypothetical protein
MSHVPGPLERFFKRFLDTESQAVDHDETSNRTHSGDSISPQSVSTDQIQGTVAGGNTITGLAFDTGEVQPIWIQTENIDTSTTQTTYDFIATGKQLFSTAEDFTNAEYRFRYIQQMGFADNTGTAYAKPNISDQNDNNRTDLNSLEIIANDGSVGNIEDSGWTDIGTLPFADIGRLRGIKGKVDSDTGQYGSYLFAVGVEVQ